MVTTPEIKERLIVPAARSSHSTLGTAYSHAGHQIEYSPGLFQTGKNYHGSKALISPSYDRMSTAAEELAIQLGLEIAGIDPRKADVFGDLFGRNGWYAWQLTETGLRVPKGRKAGVHETDPQGRKYWAREVLIGDEVVGEILVPEGHGRVVPYSKNPEDVWDLVFGLPRVTSASKNDRKHENHTTHFWFNPDPSTDSISGYQDVAVSRGRGWPHDGGEGCLIVGAVRGRSDAGSGDGFRPVRGSLPRIEKELAKTNELEED